MPKCLHSLRWLVSLCRVILDIAIGHMPMVRAEVPVGGLTRCLRSLAQRSLVRYSTVGYSSSSHRHSPTFPLWLERRPPPVPPTLAASARS